MKGAEKALAQRVLLYVEDDANQRKTLAGFLRGRGWSVLEAENAKQAEMLATEHDGSIELLLTDLRLGGPDGIDLLESLRRRDAAMQAIVVTAYGEIDDAVRAMRAGAYDFIIKPVDLQRLELLLDRALEQVLLARERSALVEVTGFALGLPGVVGTSDGLVKVAQLARRIAPATAPVMIIGESGVGKEVLARAIHAISPRKKGPFVVVNCAALTENLVESELFGHERGAFTGAERLYQGRFERAAGGTLFLDEVGDIPLSVQVKLLNVIQSGQFERVGGSKLIDADVRLISATHRDLADWVSLGRFREDLYYRIGVFTLAIPPLRQRMDDIPLLARHFVRLLAEAFGRDSWTLTDKALSWLQQLPFRGNVRELRSTIERSLVFADGDDLDQEHFELGAQMQLDISKPTQEPSEASFSPLDEDYSGLDNELAKLESSRIAQALQLSRGNKSAAARLLKMSERALRYKYQKYFQDDG